MYPLVVERAHGIFGTNVGNPLKYGQTCLVLVHHLFRLNYNVLTVVAVIIINLYKHLKKRNSALV